tara:strand:- start:1540 stop:2565 length:1026 start_codon:yes stop_codon:yes gene_type:complete
MKNNKEEILNTSQDSMSDEQIKSKYEAIMKLVDHKKNVLVLGTLPNLLSKSLSEKNCDVTFIEKNNFENKIVDDVNNSLFLDSVKNKQFDVIILFDFLEYLKESEKVLNEIQKLLNVNGCIVCSLPNISHINYRIELLNGDLTYQMKNGNKRILLQMFTLDIILLLLESTRFSINKLIRIKKNIDFSDLILKQYSIPKELIESICRDPESTCTDYVFSATLKSNNSTTREHLEEFSKNMVTDRLGQILHYYRENLVGKMEKIIQEKDLEILNLQIGENKVKKIIDETFREILRRPVDLEGLEHFEGMLEKNEITREELKNILLKSEEYKALVEKDTKILKK